MTRLVPIAGLRAAEARGEVVAFPAAAPCGPGLSPDEAARLQAFIDDRLEEGGARLAECARHLDMAPLDLRRRFPPTFGRTFRRYLLDRKLERARALIEDGELPLAEVAFAAGFCSQAHMTSAVTRAFGASPGRLREAALAEAPLAAE